METNGTIKYLMTSLIASEVCKIPLNKSAFTDISSDSLIKLYCLSKKHDIAGIVGSALLENNLISNDEIAEKFRKQIYTSVYRNERINYEYPRLCHTLDEEEIPYIPLKGAIIRSLYPQEWMRTSSDIDLLFHPEDIKRATDALVSVLNYRIVKDNDSAYHVSAFSEGNVHVEMHFGLIENDINGTAEKLLNDIWDYASVREDTQMYILSDDMFYYYHIAHMAKHFTSGGCGVRPFIDLWLLNRKTEIDRAKREKLLSAGGLLQFAQKTEKLSEVWFTGAKADTLTEQMQEYILNGGVYGTMQNNAVVAQAKKGKAVTVIFRRLFITSNEMAKRYPSISKHRWLLPFYQVRRWFDILFSKHRRKRGLSEIKANLTTNENNLNMVRKMLEELNLS